MVHIEIIEVLQEYRNGNKDILNTLYSDKVKYKNNSGFKFYDRSQFVILDNGIKNISNKIYNIYKQSGINEKAGKYTKSTYCGNENDFAKETIIVLISLFNDKSFVPATSKEVYGQLQYNLKKYMNNSLNSVCSISDVFTNYDDDDNDECSYYNFISQMPDFDFSEKYEGYIGEIKELMDILKTYDIKDFCSPNATAQKDIIDLIKSTYKYRYYPDKDDCRLPKEFEMISAYQLKYGREISQQQFSAVLDELFKILCDCTSELKGIDATRKQYCKANQRGDIYCNS